MFKTLSSDTKKQKYVWQYMQKKTEPKFGGYFISYKYRLLRCFHKWAVSKRQKKRKKNTKPRIIQIWCPREIIRNKKTREKKNGTKKNSLKKKKIYKSLSPETQSVKKHKCQETQSVKRHNVSSNKKKMCGGTQKKPNKIWRSVHTVHKDYWRVFSNELSLVKKR